MNQIDAVTTGIVKELVNAQTGATAEESHSVSPRSPPTTLVKSMNRRTILVKESAMKMKNAKAHATAIGLEFARVRQTVLMMMTT